ncbi:MAG: serpin family protein [Actinomycetia bacterium]|nr:serpin family protein [Actinomycetes bacterium]
MGSPTHTSWFGRVAIVALLIGSSVACDGDASTVPDNSGFELITAELARATSDPAEAAAAADAIRALGFDLFEVVHPDEGNLAVSPYSVAVALAMTRAGASGDTAAEMDSVLHADLVDDLHKGVGSLDAYLAERAGTFQGFDGENLELELSFGNAVWPQVGFGFEAAFLGTLAEHYGAGVYGVDYVDDTEGSRQAINGWVSDRTNERISELIPAGALDSLTRLVLTNAVYLNAPWLHPFVEGGTVDAPFNLQDGAQVTVAMMTLAETLDGGVGARRGHVRRCPE